MELDLSAPIKLGAGIDGQPRDVLRVDCILQGVWLQTGEHTVEFSYQPFGYLLGAWISVGTLLGMFVWLIISWALKKKRKKCLTMNRHFFHSNQGCFTGEIK
jgi:uncharacterized membrane protein YfhO